MTSAPLRTRIGAWIESSRVQRVIVALILVNAIILGLETSASVMARFGPLLARIDQIVLAVFVLELGLKRFERAFHRIHLLDELVTNTIPLNYQMGIGSEADDGVYPGSTSALYSDAAGRRFYARWAELMNTPAWHEESGS